MDEIYQHDDILNLKHKILQEYNITITNKEYDNTKVVLPTISITLSW
jgi:hypothetical protein